jgi:Lipocalin-like domain
MKEQFSTLKKSLLLHTLVLGTLAFLSNPAFSQMPTSPEVPPHSITQSLVGSWRLIAADKILPDGTRTADYGTDPRGIAILTDDGHYVLEIFRSDRPKFASGDRAKGTPEEYKAAVLGASCHFGTYMVNEEKGAITFHTDRASYPNWDETTRVSSFTLERDTLTWKVPPRPDGSIPVSVFTRMP